MLHRRPTECPRRLGAESGSVEAVPLRGGAESIGPIHNFLCAFGAQTSNSDVRATRHARAYSTAKITWTVACFSTFLGNSRSLGTGRRAETLAIWVCIPENGHPFGLRLMLLA